MSKKRGQTTIFMLLAIVVLLIGVLFFFSQDASLEKTEYISPELVPIKNFVDTCISNTAARGITILGLNGGYINFPQQINSNPRSYLKFTPLDDYKNPYWWYDGTESIPTEEFMVKQIEDYIISEIDTCINNFEVFSSQFDVKKLSETKVPLKTWTDYCQEIGSSRQVVNRWLAQAGYLTMARQKKQLEAVEAVEKASTGEVVLNGEPPLVEVRNGRPNKPNNAGDRTNCAGQTRRRADGRGPGKRL